MDESKTTAPCQSTEPSSQTTRTPPETGYGSGLRARGFFAEADLIDHLVWREVICDSHCGADQAMAEAWYRAEREFCLEDYDTYEAIKRLMEAINGKQ